MAQISVTFLQFRAFRMQSKKCGKPERNEAPISTVCFANFVQILSCANLESKMWREILNIVRIKAKPFRQNAT